MTRSTGPRQISDAALEELKARNPCDQVACNVTGWMCAVCDDGGDCHQRFPPLDQSREIVL